MLPRQAYLSSCTRLVAMAAAALLAGPVVAQQQVPPHTPLGQPALAWEATVSVTGELEGGDDITVDADGNAIVLGYLPVEQDFYVLKFGAGGDLIWSRTIGGSGLDVATGLEVDASGDVYLSGRTLSADFPTQRAYQDSLNGPSDAFLMKLSGADGSTVFSTYFGGSRAEDAHDVAIGADGTIYVAGTTDSTDLETVDPIQDALTLTLCFCDDVFIARFSADVDELLFGTYLGGGRDDHADGIEVDADGNICFAGRTRSDDWPTMNAVQPNNGGGEFDAFAARISADGTLAYSTYLGGEDWEIAQGMDIDDAGALYLTGTTGSILYPTTDGAFQETFVGGVDSCSVPFGPDRNCYDMFVTKLEADGSFGYSTFLGGTADDEPRNIAVDGSGRAHVVGYTFSDDFPLNAQFGNVVVAQFNTAGSRLNYVATHSTPGSNAGSGIAIAPGSFYLTSSVGLPYDTYVAKYRSRLVRLGGRP